MLQIRKAYPTDAYSLIQIYDAVWKNEFYDILPNGIFQEMSRTVEKRVHHLKDQIQENNRIFVALEDEVTIGFIFYGKTSNSVYNSAFEIRSIYILPEFQRRGIGSQLFQNVSAEIEKLGYHFLIVHCPIHSNGIDFFLKMGGKKKEVVSKELYGYHVMFELIFFDLEKTSQDIEISNEWNRMYLKAQENLFLLNDMNREIAVLLTKNGTMYLGLGIKNKVCPMESALANMHLGQEKMISKVLILNRKSKLVLPCGKCRDLLIDLGQKSAEILFDLGTLKTMTLEELNPYYKEEEKS